MARPSSLAARGAAARRFCEGGVYPAVHYVTYDPCDFRFVTTFPP